MNIQGIISTVGKLSSELLELCEDMDHHLTKAATLDTSKLDLLQLQEFIYCEEVILHNVRKRCVHVWRTAKATWLLNITHRNCI